jgi:hypothetical protein
VAFARTRDWATIDYYELLGVEHDASDEDIARAFRTRAKQLHPDAGVPLELAERFKDVTVAYEVLSNRRTRRDYDAVRASLYANAPGVQRAPFVVREGDLPPRFRASAPHPTSWTPRKAWAALIGGLAVTLAGFIVGALVLGLQHRDAVQRHDRVAVKAVRVNVNGTEHIEFTTSTGQRVVTTEPKKVNPGIPGDTVDVLYDPAHPSNVIADENYTARDVTLWLVVAKLLIGGPVFAVLGYRARRRFRSGATT